MRKISYKEGLKRGFTANEAFEVINDALGDQYNIKLLKNNTIWANEASGDNDRRSELGTRNQRAFNRVMKKISLEDGNEFNSLYRDVVDSDTRENQLIDWAVQNNVVHNNLKQFLNRRAGGRDSTKQSESPNEKVARTIKERLSRTDSHTGANIADLKTNVGHIYAQANHPEKAHFYDNTREEPGKDNQLYKNYEGDGLYEKNEELLAQSKEEGIDVEELYSTINRQMFVDSLDAADQPKAMVALNMATPEEVGLSKKELQSEKFEQLKAGLEILARIL